MNAVEFLINEHNKVRNTFQLIANSLNINERKKMFEDLAHELIAHEKMEQTVWYPALLKESGFRDIISPLILEEKSAEKTILKFKDANNDENWEELFFKLKTDVENHANEEETNLFPEVLARIQPDDLVDLRKEMEAFKLKELNKIADKNITTASSAKTGKTKSNKRKSKKKAKKKSKSAKKKAPIKRSNKKKKSKVKTKRAPAKKKTKKRVKKAKGKARAKKRRR